MNIAENTDDYIMLIAECKEDSAEFRKVFEIERLTLNLSDKGDIIGIKLWKHNKGIKNDIE